MADYSVGKVVAEWLTDHLWPKVTNDASDSVVVVTAASPDGTTFVFQSTFRVFEISATYDKNTSTLSGVAIKLFSSISGPSVVLATVDSYPISTSQGKDIKFDLGNGFITGKVSLKLGDYEGSQHIFATYEADVPYAGILDDTVDIAPSEATEGSGLTRGHLESIESLEAYHSKQVAPLTLDTDAEKLFVKHVKDATINSGDKGGFIGGDLAIVTYYEGISREYAITTSFLDIFELVGLIDPDTFTISATLYVKSGPFGRLRLGKTSGSALDGVTIPFKYEAARGEATLIVKKLPIIYHAVFADVTAWILGVGNVTSGEQTFLINLPF